jgi:site-specific DNA recombinase
MLAAMTVSRKAALYLRISSDRTGLAAGVERQEQDCRALAKRLGWEVAHVYTDNDVSAFKGTRRPAYESLLEVVKAGDVGAVIAYHPDRLYRRMADLVALVQIIESTRVKVATVAGGDVDLSTASGRRNAYIVGAIAEGEADQTRERVQRSTRQRAEKGLPPTGRRRFGYRADWTPEPDEARLLRRAAKDVLAGKSCRAVTAEWNGAGVTTVAGNPWTPSHLTRTLRSDYLAGRRVHRGQVIGAGTWKPILDGGLFDRLQAKLRDPRRQTHNGTTARKWFLGGFMLCGKCGARLTSGTNSGPTGSFRAYLCRECRGVQVKAEPVEAFITEAVLTLLLSSDRLRTALRQDRQADGAEEAVRAHAELEERLRNLSDDYYHAKRIPRDVFVEQAERLRPLLAASQERVDRLGRRDAIAALPDDEAGLRRLWGRDVETRANLVRVLFESVTVLPAARKGERFHPGRLEVRPRQG